MASGQESSPPTASVAFHVVDVFGNPLAYRVDGFALSNTKRDYTASFKGLRGGAIPYGEYFYRLRRLDFPDVGEVEGVISVNHADVWKTAVYHGVFTVIQGHPAEGLQATPRGFVVRGEVRPRPITKNPVWVRIQSLYEATAYETRLDEKGDFRVDEFLRGNYIVLVVEGSRLLSCGSVSFRPASDKPGTLRIVVSDPVPSVSFIQ